MRALLHPDYARLEGTITGRALYDGRLDPEAALAPALFVPGFWLLYRCMWLELVLFLGLFPAARAVSTKTLGRLEFGDWRQHQILAFPLQPLLLLDLDLTSALEPKAGLQKSRQGQR